MSIVFAPKLAQKKSILRKNGAIFARQTNGANFGKKRGEIDITSKNAPGRKKDRARFLDRTMPWVALLSNIFYGETTRVILFALHSFCGGGGAANQGESNARQFMVNYDFLRHLCSPASRRGLGPFLAYWMLSAGIFSPIPTGSPVCLSMNSGKSKVLVFFWSGCLRALCGRTIYFHCRRV